MELAYRFPDGTTKYRMEATASARWDIGGAGRGSYRVVFDVTEEVSEDDGDSAVVTVTMSPLEVSEEGLASPGTGDRSFAIEIDRNGGVLDVLEVDGVDATDLDPDELAFIGTYRPPLPVNPVALGDGWQSEQEVEVGPVFQQLVTLGELESLYRDADGPVAQLTYEGDGPLVWTTDLPQGSAELTGAATMEGVADFDIDAGALRSATSSTKGDFDVRVVPPGRGGTPLTGTLHFDLDLELTAAG